MLAWLGSGKSSFLFLFKIYFFEVQLIYNVVLVCGIQQSDSVSYIYMCLYIYIYIYIFFFIFFSIVVYYRILNIVPCAIQ